MQLKISRKSPCSFALGWESGKGQGHEEGWVSRYDHLFSRLQIRVIPLLPSNQATKALAHSFNPMAHALQFNLVLLVEPKASIRPWKEFLYPAGRAPALEYERLLAPPMTSFPPIPGKPSTSSVPSIKPWNTGWTAHSGEPRRASSEMKHYPEGHRKRGIQRYLSTQTQSPGP